MSSKLPICLLEKNNENISILTITLSLLFQIKDMLSYNADENVKNTMWKVLLIFNRLVNKSSVIKLDSCVFKGTLSTCLLILTRFLNL